jgi:hypothetical protein
MVREMATKAAPAKGVRASHALPYPRVSNVSKDDDSRDVTRAYRVSATVKQVELPGSVKRQKTQAGKRYLHGSASVIVENKSGLRDLQLEWPEGKLRNPSRNMAMSVCVQMDEVVRPNVGSTDPAGGWQRSIMSEISIWMLHTRKYTVRNLPGRGRPTVILLNCVTEPVMARPRTTVRKSRHERYHRS